MYLYGSLFHFRKNGIKKTVEMWKEAFSGKVTIALPVMRPFNMKNDTYSKGFNPFENHVLYKLDKRLYLAYQATKYQLSDILGIFPEIYFLSDLMELIFFRIRHRGDPEYGYNGGFKGFVIQFFRDLKFELEDYIDNRRRSAKKLKTRFHNFFSIS
jgi:hypothetical protein